MWIRFILLMICVVSGSLAHQVPAQRLDLLTKGISIPHWYWLRQPNVLVDRYVIDKDIDVLTNMGVRHVRIPFEMADLDKPRILAQLKDHIKKFVDRKIAIIVSAFGQTYNQETLSTPKGRQELQKLCAVLKDTSPDWVFLQIANEPSLENPKSWSDVQNTLIQVARQVLPDHTLITSTPPKFDSGPGDWDMIKAFHAMKPSGDENVIYAVHFYDPFFFTHQGADWDPHAKLVKKYVYPTTSDNINHVITSLPGKTPTWIIQALSKKWNKEALHEALKPVIDWQKQHQKPVMITEFGVYRQEADLESQKVWFKDVISLFNNHEIYWTLWDYDAGFGLFKIQDGFRDFDLEIAKILGFVVPEE